MWFHHPMIPTRNITLTLTHPPLPSGVGSNAMDKFHIHTDVTITETFTSAFTEKVTLVKKADVLPKHNIGKNPCLFEGRCKSSDPW